MLSYNIEICQDFYRNKEKNAIEKRRETSFFVLIFIHFQLHTLVGHQPTTVNKQTALSVLLLVKEEGKHQHTAKNKTNKHVLLLS